MNTLTLIRWRLIAAAMTVLLSPMIFAQDPTAFPFTFSAETNGLRAGLYLRSGARMLMRFDTLAATNDAKAAVLFRRYLCGPVELKSEDGRMVPLTKPEVNKPESYPVSIQWDSRRGGKPWVRDWRLELQTNKPAIKGPMTVFDYFKIRDPDAYELTWKPILYVQAESTNDDVVTFRRVVFPPIKVKTVITQNMLNPVSN